MRPSIKSVQHITAVMGQSVVTVTSLTHIFANASTYLTTGVGVTTPYAGTANREQENQIGSKIGTTIISISARDLTASGILEYAVWKRERQPAVPVAGTGLPSNARMLAVGTQTAMREEMPGRILHYGKVAVAPEQPRAWTVKINWAKFRLQTIRTGDFYGITFFNRSADTIVVDVETRYKEFN